MQLRRDKVIHHVEDGWTNIAQTIESLLINFVVNDKFV
jgi:hypothetical protein